MSYLVLARKYRPQTFDQVIKQDHITQTLSNAILSERVAHAILFSGPRGTGKTTVARILAKAMNCKEGPTPAPCNKCNSCREITSGSSVDVFEIDGASNNSVDQIRDLRENVKYMPANSLYKIYIIDEVHMLSIAAFNALLKTLEEPPSHVMFIFATTEPQKIPITILSRCQRHDFRRIDIESITGHMEMICTKEGINIPAESLWLIAREAGGSIRDALSLLDQIMICAEGTITNDQILDMLGVIDRKIIFDISKGILGGNLPHLLEIIDDIYDHGYDIKKLYADLVVHFRDLLVVKMGKKIDKLVNFPSHEIKLMHDQVKEVSETFLNQIFDLLFKEEATIKYSAQPKLSLEMAFIRMFQIKPALPIDLLIEKLDNLKNEVFIKKEKVIRETHKDKSDTKEKIISQSNGNMLQEVLSEPTGIAESNASFDAIAVDHNENLDSTWEKLFNIISENYPLLAANLAKCTLKKLTGQNLEIEVNGNDFNLNIIKRNKNVAILEKVCEDFFGKKMELIIKARKNANNKNQEKKSQGNHLKQEALSHPMVVNAIEIFNGRVVDVKLL